MADAPAADQTPNSPGTTVDPIVPPVDAPPAEKTPDLKPTDKPAEPPKAAEPAPVIPEKYDFAALKLPEGIALNADLVEAVTPVFQKHGLTQEAANELVETHAKALAKAQAVDEAKRETDFKDWMKTNVTNYQATMKKEWGTAYDANLVTAQRGMARVFSPEAKALLDETGLGNHPEFVKAFYQVGKMVNEDTPAKNSGSPAGRKSTAEVLYPNMGTAN